MFEYYRSFFNFCDQLGSSTTISRVEVANLEEFEFLRDILRQIKSQEIPNYFPYSHGKALKKTEIGRVVELYKNADFYGYSPLISAVSKQLLFNLKQILKCQAKSHPLVQTRLTGCKSLLSIPSLYSRFKAFQDEGMAENLTLMKSIILNAWHLLDLGQIAGWIVKALVKELAVSNAFTMYAQTCFALENNSTNSGICDDIHELQEKAIEVLLGNPVKRVGKPKDRNENASGFEAVASKDVSMISFLKVAESFVDPLPFQEFVRLLKNANSTPSHSYVSLLNGIDSWIFVRKGSLYRPDMAHEDPILQTLYEAKGFLISRVSKRYMTIDLSPLKKSLVRDVAKESQVKSEILLFQK